MTVSLRDARLQKVEEAKGHSFLVNLVIRLVKEKPLGVLGGVIVLVLFLTGIFADLLAPYGYNEIKPADSLQAPSAKYLLGTDNLGRDVLSRIIYGARISMYVGLSASFLNSIIGFLIGGISGFLGGKVDLVIQRFIDSFMCIPRLALYLSVMSLLGPGMVQVILVLGISGGIQCRVERSLVIAAKEHVYVEAATAIGCSTVRIFFRHILPNVVPGLIIIFSVSIGSMILSEATLSFLGFGIPPPVPSWGGMLSGSGRQFMLLAPWMVLWPGLALGSVIFGMNMLGDAMRDLLDPRLRGGLGRYGGMSREKLPKLVQSKKD